MSEEPQGGGVGVAEAPAIDVATSETPPSNPAQVENQGQVGVMEQSQAVVDSADPANRQIGGQGDVLSQATNVVANAEQGQGPLPAPGAGAPQIEVPNQFAPLEKTDTTQKAGALVDQKNAQVEAAKNEPQKRGGLLGFLGKLSPIKAETVTRNDSPQKVTTESVGLAPSVTPQEVPANALPGVNQNIVGGQTPPVPGVSNEAIANEQIQVTDPTASISERSKQMDEAIKQGVSEGTNGATIANPQDTMTTQPAMEIDPANRVVEGGGDVLSQASTVVAEAEQQDPLPAPETGAPQEGMEISSSPGEDRFHESDIQRVDDAQQQENVVEASKPAADASTDPLHVDMTSETPSSNAEPTVGEADVSEAVAADASESTLPKTEPDEVHDDPVNEVVSEAEQNQGQLASPDTEAAQEGVSETGQEAVDANSDPLANLGAHIEPPTHDAPVVGQPTQTVDVANTAGANTLTGTPQPVAENVTGSLPLENVEHPLDIKKENPADQWKTNEASKNSATGTQDLQETPSSAVETADAVLPETPALAADEANSSNIVGIRPDIPTGEVQSDEQVRASQNGEAIRPVETPAATGDPMGSSLSPEPVTPPSSVTPINSGVEVVPNGPGSTTQEDDQSGSSTPPLAQTG